MKAALARLLPGSMFGQLMLIWVLGLSLLLAGALWLIAGERARLTTRFMAENTATRIAALVERIEAGRPERPDPPALLRPPGPPGLPRPPLRGDAPPPPPDESAPPRRLLPAPPPGNWQPVADDDPLVQALQSAMPSRKVAVLARRDDALDASQRRDARPPPGLVQLELAPGVTRYLRLPPLPRPEHPGSPVRLLAVAAALLLGLSAIALVAVRLATRPLSRLAQAAEDFDVDGDSVPLSAHGSDEVRRAANAFNAMQARVRQQVKERTEILAAISHDLQTPITRLRLRAEMIDDEALRARIHDDLDAMHQLVREGLDLARSRDAAAPMQLLALDSLLEALADDAHAMNWPVQLESTGALKVSARPLALRRALWNLIENGVKFGSAVTIRAMAEPTQLIVEVADDGPGLPDAERERVFEPFYRVEGSRSRASGGTGLGLAICRNLLAAQGMQVTLHNRTPHGLVARVTMPLAGNRARA